MASHVTRSRAIKRQAPAEYANPTRSDIFDTLSSWLDSPVLAYSSWIKRQQLRGSTKEVYIAMFGRFCQWLETQQKRIDQVEASDIARFLDAPNPNAPELRRHAQKGRQRQQYVRQLERVFAHLGALGHQGENPGQKAGLLCVGAGSDKPTRFLTPEESKAVMVLIKQKLDELRKKKKGAEDWVEYRDLALISAMIGGGLKVSHAMRLTLNCIDLNGERIDLSGQNYAHRARLLAFARAPIKAWIDLLSEMRGGEKQALESRIKVFEADRSSGFGRHSTVTTLSASSIHRRVQRFLKAAGVTGERASAQTLRNTYAGLLIDGGATNEHLIDYLGLRATETAIRLRSAYTTSRKAMSDNPLLEEAA